MMFDEMGRAKSPHLSVTSSSTTLDVAQRTASIGSDEDDEFFDCRENMVKKFFYLVYLFKDDPPIDKATVFYKNSNHDTKICITFDSKAFL